MKKLILLLFFSSQIFTGQTPCNLWEDNQLSGGFPLVYLSACQNGPVYQNIGSFWNPEQGTVIITIWSVDSVPFTYYLLDGGGDIWNPEEGAEVIEGLWTEPVVYQSSTSFLSFSANICFPEEYLDDFPDSVTYVAYTINCGNTGMGTGLNINDDEKYDISIYPNPSSKYINVNIDTKLEAVVFDLLGKELIREKITGRLDISSLEKGTYILNLTDGVNTSTHKIIKE